MRNRSAPQRAGSVRIIAGVWRGRRLCFPDVPGLRPSPDRVRVTLFNWLMPYLGGAHCLDLYAGSGAFGFEALSRGAASALFVERHAETAAALAQHMRLWPAPTAELAAGTVETFLAQKPRAFDIVFLDPPFAEACGPGLLDRLASGWVHADSLVYWESAAADPGEPSAAWCTIRDKKLARVRSRLLRWDSCPS